MPSKAKGKGAKEKEPAKKEQPVGPPGGPVTVHQASPAKATPKKGPEPAPDKKAAPVPQAAAPAVESTTAPAESKGVKWDAKEMAGKSIEELRQIFTANLGRTEGVQVELSPQYTGVPSGVYYEMPLLLTITSGNLGQAYSRPPINLCIVLDRSGSMEATIENCKEAISNIIRNLTPDDLLHLVVYDDRVDTVFSNMRSDQAAVMTQKTKEIKARGGTDLHSGLMGGIQVLLSSEGLGSKAVFLFSDGLATTGEKDGQKIGLAAQAMCIGKNITISTFGIGNSYDEKLLRTIANLGGGYYYYIEDAGRIPHVVQQGLSGLANFWTQDAEMLVQGRGGTVVKEVTGLSSLIIPKKFKIRERGLIQHLVRAVHTGDGPAEVVVHLRFTDFAGRKVQKTTSASWRPLANPFDMKTEEHPDVQCYLRMLQCSDLNKEISEMIAANKPQEEVKQKKEKIVALYEEVLPLDRFCIIPALLTREKETLAEFQSKGVYTEAAVKKQNYYAAKSAGYKAESYDVGREAEEEDCADMGFGLFD